jgi:hypothetical protein
MTWLAPARIEESCDHAVRDRFVFELRFRNSIPRADVGLELASFVGAEPSFVYISGVRTIEEVLQTSLDVGLKSCSHAKRRPGPLSDVRELEGGGCGFALPHVDPEIAILFLDWVGTDCVARQFDALA